MEKNKNRHELTIKIEGEEWTSAIDKAYKKKNKDVKIPGFRKGTAPKEIFIKKFGIESLYMDAVDDAVSKAYTKIINDEKLIPIVEPKLDVKKVDEKGVEFLFTIITKPEIKLGEYTKLGVKKEKAKVTKKEIEEEIKHLQDQMAEIVVKEKGTVAKGDTAVIDFDGKVDGKPLDGGKGENYPLEIGSNTFIPGFEEALIGMGIEETKEINLKFPENYTEELKNKDVTFKVTVHEIKERVLPELNKEFFEDLGYKDVKDEKEFEAKVKESIKDRKNAQNEDKYINDCLEAAVKDMKVEVNHEIIHDEIHRMMHQMEDQMRMQGLSLEQYLEFTHSTIQDLENQMHGEAENRVKTRFLLEAVAEKEKIEISDKDADKEAQRLAENYGMTKEDLITQFGGIEMVKYDLKMRKAIEIVKGE